MPIPDQICGRNYISLATFRKNGQAVQTPVWFGEEDGKLYVKTRANSGKVKRVRNNPQVRIAPCSMSGRIVGPEFAATALLLPAEDWPRAATIVERKYWLARLSLSNKKNVYLEIAIS